MSNMKRYLEAQQARADAAKGFTDLKSKISKGKGSNIISTIKTIDMGKVLGVIPFTGSKIRKEAKGGLQEATARLKAQGLKKGGSPKKKKKFPDLCWLIVTGKLYPCL